MARSLVAKVAIGSLLIALVIAGSLPFGLYWIGLSNIEGRPEPLVRAKDISSDTELLQQEFRNQPPITIRVLNPWTFIEDFLTDHPKDLRLDNGSHAIWMIARDYNYTHLKDRKMGYWHLSGAALSIWLSRTWTSDEIVAKAAAIVRTYRPPFDSSSLNEVRRFEALPENLQWVLRKSFEIRGEGPEGRCCVFLVGGVGETSALVAYENYGFIPTYRAHAFVQTKAKQWVYAGEWTISSVSTLEKLKAVTSRPPDSI
jgi:hypothetical protein